MSLWTRRGGHTDLESRLTVSSGKDVGGRMGGWTVREFGMDMCTGLYLRWITNKDLLCNTQNPAQCYVAAWMGGEFRGEWIHVYVWLSPLTAHLKPSQHC